MTNPTGDHIHNDQNGFPHFGMINARGKSVVWREKAGGEIVFAQDSGLEIPLGELKLPEDQKLAVVNSLLAHYRSHAIGCENKYYAAAAGITKEGNLFLETNNMIHIQDKFYRGCAETPLLRKAQGAQGKTDVNFDEVYLMSGIAEKKSDKMKDKQPGHVACMCGECRANLCGHTKTARFIMVPTNDGNADLTINKTATAPSELGVGEAWEISHATMYPLSEHKTLGKEHNHIVREGYYHIIDERAKARPLQTQFSTIPDSVTEGNITLSVADYRKLKSAYEDQDFSLQALNDNPTLENINRAMVRFTKKAYAAHADKIDDKKNIDINVIILKTNKGEFFPGVLVNGELWLPNKPAEMPVALANAYNQIGIAEIYMMNFNDQQIRGELSAWTGGSQEGHSMKMPGPAALGRLIKNLKESDDPVMTILPVNDGKPSEAELKDMKIDINVRDAFGPGYTNPKRTNGHGHTH